MQDTNNVQGFIREAIECSVYLSPRDIGLTPAELQEAASQAGYRPGEVGDALGQRRYVGGKCCPNDNEVGLPMGLLSTDFNFPFTPDLRDWKVFEFVRQELADLKKEVGAAWRRT